jgi:Zn-dependent protease
MFVTSIEFIGYIAIFLFSLVIHENVHARVAYYLGDSTAKDMGRFSFNPLKHVTLAGILLPIGLHLINAPIFGFAKPVPYNQSSFKNPRRDMILVGLAAPFANFILAVIACLLCSIRLSILPEIYLLYFDTICATIFKVNFLLCVFNLLPIPPLDGSIIYMSTVINKNPKLSRKFEDQGFGILFFLLIIMPLIGKACGKDYNIIGIYIRWCLDEFVSILSSLAG